MARPKNGKNRRLSSLILAETLIIAYVMYVSFYVVQLADPFAPPFSIKYLIVILLYTAFSVLSSLAVGLYEPKLRESFRGVIRRLFVAHGLSFFAIVVFSALFLQYLSIHDYFFIISAALSIITVTVFRNVVMRFNALGLRKSRIVVLGAGERASIIEKRMRRASDRKGFNLVGFIPIEGDSTANGIVNETQLDINVDDSFKNFILENEIDEIVVACDQRRGTLPIEVLFDCRLQGVEITDLLDFMERETGQILVNLMYPSWLIYSSGFQSQNYVRQVADYTVNLILGSLVLFFVWPFMLLTALMIYLDDGRKNGASVFYKQARVGKDGALFYIYKFRSMRVDAEKEGAKWASKNDSRVTRVGNFIRKYRLDELPQLYNIFRGDMSFVGPRPERPEFVTQLVKEIPFYNQRHNVKPGLAGWAQLNYPYGASVEDAAEKLKFDLYYVKHQSFLLDLLVLVRTVEIVLFGKGQ